MDPRNYNMGSENRVTSPSSCPAVQETVLGGLIGHAINNADRTWIAFNRLEGLMLRMQGPSVEQKRTEPSPQCDGILGVFDATNARMSQAISLLESTLTHLESVI